MKSIGPEWLREVTLMARSITKTILITIAMALSPTALAQDAQMIADARLGHLEDAGEFADREFLIGQ